MARVCRKVGAARRAPHAPSPPPRLQVVTLGAQQVLDALAVDLHH